LTPGQDPEQTTNDYELIQGLVKGDKAAFEAIVRRYQGSVRSILRRLCGNPEDAEDMGQETFIRVYKSARGFQGRSSLKTWILKIAVNLAIDLNRKTKRTPSFLPMEDSLLRVLSQPSSDNPQVKARVTEKRRFLNRALDLLPVKQRTALLLKITEGLPYKEIAVVMGGTKEAAKANVHLARKRMMALMGEDL